ncbi:MAG TPA: glucose-1-phosphate cytidylyltransferase [Methylomirabilota bacterium]|nr:glucose-1-phosphate cytidylyltransferase [Methylomirabilota bacterium]
MKVVLFCGGLGLRLREAGDNTPKPLVNLGYRPILWHVMNYYAHFGHKEFILCLGYRGDLIKQYFLEYNECLSNNFTLSEGGRRLELLTRDIQDWKITFVDTGHDSCVGERLYAVRDYLRGEEMFLANYSDGLSDVSLDRQLAHFRRRDAVASFVSIRPNVFFHFVSARPGGQVTGIADVRSANVRINGGFFIFRQEIFKYLRPGEELVEEPFQRLIRRRRLLAYQHDGFWACMDTYKDRQRLEDLARSGQAPWEFWKTPPARARPAR